MLDKAEIRAAIAKLEFDESSYSNYAVTAEPATVGEYGDSEFLLAVAGKDPAKAWTVIDELMDTLAMVNSKVYNSVMQKIKRV